MKTQRKATAQVTLQESFTRLNTKIIARQQAEQKLEVARQEEAEAIEVLLDLLKNEGVVIDPSKVLIESYETSHSSWSELVERQYKERAQFIHQNIQDAQGNMSEAARRLGIKRQTLMQNIGTLRKKDLWPYD